MKDISKLDAEKLFAVMLLTDGCVKWNKAGRTWYIDLNNSDPSMHRTYKELGEHAFGEKMKSFMFKDGRVFVSRYSRRPASRIPQRLFSLTANYKTKEMGDPMPSISFLFGCSKKIQKMAIRIAMSADGFVGVSSYKSNRKQPRMGLVCAHPGLIDEWSTLLNNIGIKMELDTDSATWSGLHGLRTTKISEIIKFKKIGGFYPLDIKVTRGNFKGQMKNDVLNHVVETFG